MCKVIICVRVRNEERWLRLLLKRLYLQTFKDFEIVIVDNKSTDYSRRVAESDNVTIIDIENYNPSLAINIGLKNAKSYDNAEIAVLISAHCIPVNEYWLEKLVNAFNLDDNIVGVYGRQVPMRSSNPDNLRDLLYAFGEKSLMHKRNVFFHNANSAVRMNYFKQNQFDETIAHIEDLAWAKLATQNDKKIYYCADALVWHQHGLHQHNNASFRSRTVSETLLGLSGYQFPKEDIFDFKKLKKIFIHENVCDISGSDRSMKDNELLSANLGMNFIHIPEHKDKPLFARIRDAIPDILQIETDLVFFWSSKYGSASSDTIFACHNLLISEGTDAVIPMRELSKGLCVSNDDQSIKFTPASALSANKFYTTSFGRGSLFWNDSLRSNNLEALKLSRATS